MRKRTLGLTLPLGLSGCALFGTGRTVHATLAHQGTAVRLAPGDDLALTLPTDSLDGLDWAPVAYDEDILSHHDDPEPIRTLRNGKPDPWAPAFERHTFRARSAGRGEILMGPPGAEPLQGGLAGPRRPPRCDRQVGGRPQARK